ncbi:MAG: ankyrin repeat domain-containing protein [Alphaproteobacteria bacterium]|nr:ankyrin repeat domain-containing protein [Alphaproteobacteria bacterium]
MSNRSPAPTVARRRLLGGFTALAAARPVSARAQGRDVDRALIAAAASGDVGRVVVLLREGADVDARDARGRTALLVATRANRPAVARVLIAAGADVNAQDDQRDSAFLYAGAEGLLEILELTLAADADLRSTNRYGGTALIPAAHHGHVETVRRLLATAIDVDHVNNLGWTALLEAVILGDGGPAHTRIVELLLAAKADPNLADRDGVTPIAHARRRGYAAITALLERAGAR